MLSAQKQKHRNNAHFRNKSERLRQKSGSRLDDHDEAPLKLKELSHEIEVRRAMFQQQQNTLENHPFVMKQSQSNFPPLLQTDLSHPITRININSGNNLFELPIINMQSDSRDQALNQAKRMSMYAYQNNQSSIKSPNHFQNDSQISGLDYDQYLNSSSRLNFTKFTLQGGASMTPKPTPSTLPSPSSFDFLSRVSHHQQQTLLNVKQKLVQKFNDQSQLKLHETSGLLKNTTAIVENNGKVKKVVKAQPLNFTELYRSGQEKTEAKMDPVEELKVSERSPRGQMKFIIDDNFNTLGRHLKSVLRKLEEEEHWLGDPDALDIGIWDPRFNVKKKHSKNMTQRRAKSQLKEQVEDYQMYSKLPLSVIMENSQHDEKSREERGVRKESPMPLEQNLRLMQLMQQRLGGTQIGDTKSLFSHQSSNIGKATPLTPISQKQGKFNFISTMKRLVLKSKKEKNSVSPKNQKNEDQNPVFNKEEAEIQVNEEERQRQEWLDKFMNNIEERKINPREFDSVMKRHSREEVRRVIEEIVDRELQLMEAQIQREGSEPFKMKKVLEGEELIDEKQKLLSKVSKNIIKTVKFGELMKHSYSPKPYELLTNDIRFKYFISCQKYHTSVLPILHKIQDGCLNLANYTLPSQLAFAIGDALQKGTVDKSFTRLILDSNGLKDEDFAAILKGLMKIQEIKCLIYVRNDFGMKSLERLKPLFSQKIVPYHLEELRLINCGQIQQSFIASMLDSMLEKCYIRKLSLVALSIDSEIVVTRLTKLIRTQRQIMELDLSSNRLRPKPFFLDFLKALAENRTLQSVDLSWNNLIARSELNECRGGPPSSEIIMEMSEEQIKREIQAVMNKREKGIELEPQQIEYYVIGKLSQLIKYNFQLQDLDLSNAGLTELAIKTIGFSIRRAKSLLSLHLSDNPGVTTPIKSYLYKRTVSKTLRPDIFPIDHSDQEEESLNIFEKTMNYYIDECMNLEDLVKQGFKLSDINTQVKNLKTNSNSDSTTENLNLNSQTSVLLFQRYLGHKLDIPDSGRWQMLTQPSQNCWICDRHIYGMIFWSRDIGKQASYSLKDDDKAFLIEQLTILGKKQEPQFEVPIIIGTFTHWKPAKMIKLSDLCASMSNERLQPNFLEILQEQHGIRKDIQTPSELDKHEQFLYAKLIIQHEQHRMQGFKNALSKGCRYQKPFMVNEEMVSIPSFVNIKKKKSMTPAKNKLRKNLSEEQDDSALSKDSLSDEEDKAVEVEILKDPNQEIYVLPTFFKPGRHSYAVRYLNSKGKEETYFHGVLTPPRYEDIPPFLKRPAHIERIFKKEASVFRDWKEDTVASLTMAAENDFTFWKIPRFVKDDQDIYKLKDYVRKNFGKLKDMFISIAVDSIYPNISLFDFHQFVEKCRILDGTKLDKGMVDRMFIATNYELQDQDENPDRALNRFEFIEILIRLGAAKYRDTERVTTHHEALDFLLTQDIYPHHHFPWQQFRDETLWTIEVNDILESNLGLLLQIFSKFANNPKRVMAMQDALDLMAKLTPVAISYEKAKWCYGMSKMTIINENENVRSKYLKIQFVEFLEMIGRVAEERFRGTGMANLSILSKLEYVLDDLLTYIGAERRDVEIGLDEQSASDDEY